MGEVNLDELNKMKEEIAEKERKMAEEKSHTGQQSAPQATPVQPQSQPTPVQVPPVTQAPTPSTTVIFQPQVKEPDVKDRALSQVQKSSEEAGQVVSDIFKQGIVHVVSTDEEVRGKILGTAKKAVEDKVEAISDQTTKEAQASAYDANSDACENYGIMKDVPKWKINMMRAGSAFWFIIYFIFASLTVAPITIFIKGLVGVIKQTWIAVVVGILFYLAIAVGVPLITTLISK